MSDVTPALSPASTSAFRTHTSNERVVQPAFEVDTIARRRDGGSCA
jgi:hypothetical protein